MTHNQIIYTTRQAVAEDAEILLEFTRIEAQEAETKELDLELVKKAIELALIDPEHKAYYVALIDQYGVAQGHCSFIKEWSDWNCAYYLWIQSMFIHPRARGTGGMKYLLDAVENVGRTMGAPEIRIYVHRGNQRALRAWQREGFVDANYWMAHRLISDQES